MFVVEGLAIFLFASIDKFGFALSLALLCGLVFSRQNVLAVAPCFIVANCVFSLDWYTLSYAISPVVLLILLYAIFYKLKRNVPLWSIALCAVISTTPYAVCNCLFYGTYLEVGISVLLVLAFTFCCGICCYALFVRGLMHKLTVDEGICSGLVLCVVGYALSTVGGYGFFAYHVVLGLAVMLCSMCCRVQTTLFVGILLGAGASLRCSDLGWLGASVACSAVAVAFSPFTRWTSALAVLAAESIMWLTDAYSGAGWQSALMCACGVLCAVFMPASVVAKIKCYAKSDDRRAYSAIVNRRGRELATRLSSASDVFYDVSKNLEKIANDKCECSPDKLAKEVARSFCGKCADREICFSALGTDTSGVLLPMADAAISRGKATILDIPPFITSRCSNMHTLSSVINSSAEAYKAKTGEAKGLTTCKRMMSEQFAGVSLVLDSLAEACAQQVSFAGDDVEMLKDELLKHNIVANEIVLSGEDDKQSATLIVRASDAQKAILPKIVSKNLRCRMELASISDRGSSKAVYLQCAPTYEIAYGISQKTHGEEQKCGDTTSVLCPSRSKRLFAVCDGMGHGERASEASKSAVQMIESFYRAGIESGIVLSIVNKLLRLSADEAFSSLDIAVIDVQTGGLDVVKLGSASSFIVRRENVEMLTCTCAPMGILDNVESITSRYQLFDGDMLVMMSDGVFDVLDGKGVVDAIDEIDTSNPQTLADYLLEKALERGATDDCTVLALRLFTL